MTCEFEAQIDDFIDGALGAAEAGAFAAHLRHCRSCAAAVADIRAIRGAARVLEPKAPPPEVWTKIAATLAAEDTRRFDTTFGGWQTLAAAAAVMFALGLGVWMAWQQFTAAAPPTTATAVAPAETTTPDPVAAESDASQFQLAEADFTTTIQGLEAIAKAESSALDPETAEVVTANLTVIDQAIGETRAALAAEPTNPLAQDSLFGALQSKVSLLQDTIALINEMRKGNPEGTARIVSGMNP